jgi:hypothetical protein
MTAEERKSLRKIRHLRRWLWVLLLIFIPLVWLTIILAQSRWVTMVIVMVWVAAVVRCASRAAFSHCPRCCNYFHATAGTPSFWNLLARRCTHCGLPLRSDRVMYPGMS